MLNKTQRNFRKQMKELEKEREKQSGDNEVLSYIDKSSTRRSRSWGTSFGRYATLAIIIIGAIIIYGNYSLNLFQVPEYSFFPGEIEFDPELEYIFQQLEFMNDIDLQIQEIVDFMTIEYSSSWEDETIKDQYVKQMKQHQLNLNQIAIEIIESDYPKEMNAYMKKVSERVNHISVAIVHAINAVTDKDLASDREFQLLINQINIDDREVKTEFNQLFKQLGFN